MSEFGDIIKGWYRTGGMAVKLIFANTIVFIVLNILFEIIFRSAGTGNQAFLWLAGTSDFGEFIYKPWSIFTNIFVHANFGHFALNMLWLYIFGRLIQAYTTQKRIFALYMVSGMVGTLLFMVLFNVLPIQNAIPIVGASGAIMGILGAAIAYNPRQEISLIIFKLPLILLGLVYLLSDLATVSSFGGNMGGSIAHIGGLVFGFLAVQLNQTKGMDLIGWFNKLIDRLINIFRGASSPKQPKMKVKYKNKDFKKKSNASQRKTDEQFNEEKVDRQAKIDAILDKIKRSGYESLSKAEKDFLFREGQKL